MSSHLRILVLFCITSGLVGVAAMPGSAYSRGIEEDTIRRFQPRKVLLLTDTSEAAQLQRTQLFYDQLKNKFYRRSITRELYDLVFDAPSRPHRSHGLEEALEYFQLFEGKVIEEVRIKKLPLFGPSVSDTTRRASHWLQHTGNALHFQTQDWVIRKNLLFAEGETVDPETLYDNERLLRSLSFIRDARIRLLPSLDNPNAVRVEVITQDVFPLSFDAGRGGFSSYSLAVQNNNIFGIGHRLTSEAVYRSNGSPRIGYVGNYTVQNVNGTFIDASVMGAYTDFERGMGISLQRPFFTPDVRWAGGVELRRNNRLTAFPHRNAALDTLVWYAHDWLDVWAGYALPLNEGASRSKGRESLVLSARALRIYHSKLPEGELRERNYFQDRKIWLGSASWVRRNYRRDAYIYGFGRTEDVPLGAIFSGTVGAERQQQMLYYGQLNASWGSFIPNLGYLTASVAAGQYLGYSGTFTRKLRYGGLQWISPLITQGRYRVRQLFNADYLYGGNRFDYEFISVSDREIRGLNGVDVRGTQRINLSAETVVFLPVQLLGFRMAGFVFADVAVLNTAAAFSVQGTTLQGYGLGVRVRNENLAFKIFQLRLGYYPVPGGGFSISLHGSPSGMFRNFSVGRPNIHPFE